MQETPTNDGVADPKFQKGFNDGYLLSKFQPELSQKLATHKQRETPYLKGFTQGVKEYESEVLSWAKSFKRDSPEKETGRDSDRER